MATENFEVKIPSNSVVDVVDDVVIVTSGENDSDITKQVKASLEQSALDFEQKRHTYSRYLGGEESTTDTLTLSDIDTYADNPQGNLSNIKKINSIVKQYVNKDDIIGKVYESVQIYTNTQYTLEYPKTTDENNQKQLKEVVEPFIESFNRKIDIEKFINLATSTSFLEGNFISYLRTEPKTQKAIVDFYPVSLIEISEYTIDGEPAILFDVNGLKTKLRINSRKKKNGKDIFYDKADEVIKNSYPKEIYDAYKNNERYALLDPKKVGVVRINNLGGLYGLTPIFKALKPALLLEGIGNADETIVKVRSKKIVHQKLRKEIAGTDYAKQALNEMQYAHNNLVSAWKNKTVLVTTPWWVESIAYISDDTPLTDTDTLKTYRSRVFNALGINFMDTEANLNLSNVSIKDLMKTIDKIAEEIAKVVNKYYKVLLEENKIDINLAPKIKIASSEMLSMEMRQALATFMYTTLGASLDTCYNIVGVSNVDTEAAKRKAEKDNGIEEALTPHANYFNQTGKENNNDTNDKITKTTEPKKSGRPKAKQETKKQAYDKTRQESKVE